MPTRKNAELARNLYLMGNELLDMAAKAAGAEETALMDRPGIQPRTDTAAVSSDRLSLALAREIYKERERRRDYFEVSLFGEPGWDIMLDLFIAECEGKSLSISAACAGAGVPSTTALRWIAVLVDKSLIARFEDESDQRRRFVMLTEQGKRAMRAYLENSRRIKVWGSRPGLKELP